MTEQWIAIHQDAPPKPAYGAPCNGCGVCCASEPCPISYALLGTRNTSCKALEWHGTRYYCGMVLNPSVYLKWLPKRFEKIASKLFKRWIAADWVCDSDAQTQ